MKKIIVSSLSLLVVVVGIITGKIFDNSKPTYDEKLNQVEIIGVDQDESESRYSPKCLHLYKRRGS